ncbi:MAG TPA: hypothetical protein VEU73_08470 [Gemmatimonadales bacterium]|nr:hypothetical protein [Gemmatimonadales bacterium]
MKPSALMALVAPALAAAAIAALTVCFKARPLEQPGVHADPRGAIFVQRGCQECHAVAALGVKAATDVGPDLTFAYADVVNRYGLSLEAFFDAPPGLKGFVHASHVHLTPQDGDSISRILRAVYYEHLADMDPDMPSSPPGRARVRARPESLPRPPSRD